MKETSVIQSETTNLQQRVNSLTQEVNTAPQSQPNLTENVFLTWRNFEVLLHRQCPCASAARYCDIVNSYRSVDRFLL